MQTSSLGYAPVGQTFAAQLTYNGPQQASYIPATHTFVAPETAMPPEKYTEVAGDYVDTDPPPIDEASFKSISGLIITNCFVMTSISFFLCVGRPDFTLAVSLFGLYVWCISSAYDKGLKIGNVSSYLVKTDALLVADPKTEHLVRKWTLMAMGALVVDAFWIFFAHAAWTCDFETKPKQESFPPTFCFDEDTDIGLISSYRFHRNILRLSVLNMIILVS